MISMGLLQAAQLDVVGFRMRSAELPPRVRHLLRQCPRCQGVRRGMQRCLGIVGSRHHLLGQRGEWKGLCHPLLLGQGCRRGEGSDGQTRGRQGVKCLALAEGCFAREASHLRPESAWDKVLPKALDKFSPKAWVPH